MSVCLPPTHPSTSFNSFSRSIDVRLSKLVILFIVLDHRLANALFIKIRIMNLHASLLLPSFLFFPFIVKWMLLLFHSVPFLESLFLSTISASFKDPFVRQLRNTFYRRKKIGSCKLFLLSLSLTSRSLLLLLLHFHYFPFFLIFFPFPFNNNFPHSPHSFGLIYCFRSAIINNNYSNSSNRNV